MSAPVIIGKNSGAWGLLNERLIVTRAQDHILVTSDGEYHALVNLGGLGGLTMFTSTDQGVSWTRSFSIPDTDRGSTSDIQVMADGETLVVAYLNDSNNVIYAEYDYNTEADSWSHTMSSVVDSDKLAPSVHPTVTITDSGRAIVSYTEATHDGLRGVVAVTYGTEHKAWLQLDSLIPDATKGTARAITADDKTGIIYTTDDGMYWATLDANRHIVKEQIYDSTAPGIYASHYSSTTFGDDIYVATVDLDGHLAFLSYDGATDSWSEPRTFYSPDFLATSTQISVSDNGTLYVIFDDETQPNLLIVAESTDGGESWHHEASLVCPVQITDPPMRFEAPEHFTGDLVVMQQILSPENPSLNGIYTYVVDVDGNNPATVVAASDMSLL